MRFNGKSLDTLGFFGCLVSGLLMYEPQVIQGEVSSSDWIQFRGNQGLGLADGNPPIHWDETENVLWQESLPGSGWSSPVIKDERIYLTAAVDGESEPADELSVFCYDFSSGKLLWRRGLFTLPSDGVKHSKNSHASATPVIGDGRVYVHFGHYGTACVSSGGEVIWKQESLAYEPVHGNGGSPVLVGNRLIYSADGKRKPVLIALDSESGALLWKRPRVTGATRKFSFSTPTVVPLGDGHEIVSAASGAVFGYDPVDGREKWRVDYGQGYSVVPRPVYGKGHVYVATGFGRPKVMAIRLGGSGNVTESHVVWETSRSGPKTPSMLLHEDLLYYVSDGGIVSCVEALTGDPIWQDRIKGNVSSSPVIAGGRIYVGTEEGVVYVLATGREFRQLAANDFGERIFASPAVSDNALIIRTESTLYRIESK